MPQDRYTAKVLAMDPGASSDFQRRLGDSLLEGIASVLVVIGVGVLFGNKVSAYACFFGSCSTPTTENVVTFWVTTSIMAVLVILTLRSARARGSWPAFTWHVIVGLVASAAIVLFSVPLIDVDGLVDVMNPPLPPPPTGCFGDSCTGG